jgi:hypothetical protein
VLIMPPYTEVQEPVTPTYEPENSDVKDVNNDSMPPSGVLRELPEPPFHPSSARATSFGESRQPRGPRRRVQSMPVNSEAAQDFFAASPTCTRFERQRSAQAYVPSKLDTLIQRPEDDIEEVVRKERNLAVKANDLTHASTPNNTKDDFVHKNHQVDMPCSCAIL